MVLGYDAVRHALNDRSISKDMVAALAGDPDVVAEGLPGPAFSRHMLNVDPPDHTRLRRLVARAFSPSRVASLEPSVWAAAEDLLDELDAAGPGATVDLVEGYAAPLPFRVIGALLGIPLADQPQLHTWFRALLSGWVGDPPPEAVEASDGIVAYLGDLVDQRQAEPADDLVSVLVTASEGEQLTRQEVLSSLFQLVVAGHDTTSSLIGNGVVALLDHPEQLGALVADLDQVPTAVEELLRFDAPAPHATFRMTTEPVVLDGVEVPAGQQVLVCLAAANRDPERFEEPDAAPTRPRRGSLTPASATASTSASAHRWRAWRRGWRSRRCCAATPTCTSPSTAARSSGRAATASCCAGSPRSPSSSARRR